MISVDFRLPRSSFDMVVKERFSGGITGVYGASGSGKTSIFRAIAGLETPSAGRIVVGDHTLFDSSKGIDVTIDKRRLGYVFQEGRLFPHMRVRQNLEFGLKNGRDSNISFDETIQLLQLTEILDRYPHEISGGEQQRVALGRALLSSPDLLLLDEPFSAIDVHLRQQIIPFIHRIHRRTTIPVLVISHDLEDLLKLTNTLLLIEKGIGIGHGHFHDLLQRENCLRLLEAGRMINAIEMIPKGIEETGIGSLLWKEGDKSVVIRCEMQKDYLQAENRVRVIIEAGDIALSTKKLDEISIQNQLDGEIVQIITSGAKKICIINVGFTLLVEVTNESLKRMELTIGSRVWCLFKSVAVDLV
jgi:molybdate transport system ATP-binding protein